MLKNVIRFLRPLERNNLEWGHQIGRMLLLSIALQQWIQDVGDVQLAVSIYVAVTPASSKSLSISKNELHILQSGRMMEVPNGPVVVARR
ncbi:hypothetical protein C0J52_17734 [Blattella germanica]|nr:hypothetical protein C0J52_17734 [Blattella germanica]